MCNTFKKMQLDWIHTICSKYGEILLKVIVMRVTIKDLRFNIIVIRHFKPKTFSQLTQLKICL